MDDPNERIEAYWVKDSETSEYVLVDSLTSKELMRTKQNPFTGEIK